MADITGTNGNDYLVGTADDDVFRPLPGNDTIEGGGSGVDTLIIDYSGNDSFDSNNQILVFDTGAQGSFTGAYPNDRVDFTAIQRIDWRGGSRSDGIAIVYTATLVQPALAGALVFDGGGGSNSINLDFQSIGFGVSLQLGNDTTSAFGSFRNFGRFLINGSALADNLIGGAGRDALIGNDGNDVIGGDEGDDTLRGGLGNDALIGGTGADRIEGGDGNDSLYSALGFFGGVNAETGNLLSGGAGDDVLVGGWGDSIDGGSGSDTVILDLSAATAGITLSLAALVGGGTVALGGGFVTGVEGYVGILATPFDDDIAIGAIVPGYGIFFGLEGIQAFGGNDRVTGGSNNDQLFGGDGNDTLIGASGLGDYDLMDGGSGNDVYRVDTGADLTFEAAGGGIDTVFAEVTGNGYYLYAETQHLTLVGQTVFGVGDELANRLTGSDFGNTLLGGEGNDTIDGAGGVDILYGQGGSDVFVFRRGGTADVIADFTPGSDRLQVLGTGVSGFAQLLANASQFKGSTAIDMGGGEFVILLGVTRAALAPGDFLFG